MYTARRYPQEYWNRTAFVCGPTGHLVGTFVLHRKGTDYRSTYRFNLAASDDEWTAPIMAEVGPDGNVWMLDWYNFIVQHNPTPAGFETGRGNAYETDLRDKRHGRIYRFVYEPAGPSVPYALAPDDPQAWASTLAHPNLLWRRHAQRRIVERGGTDVVPRLLELVRDRSLDPIGLNVGAIHALWTLHGLGVLDGSHTHALAAATDALQHPSAGVRRNAVQVLPLLPESAERIVAARLLEDPDPQVRLAALLALADQPRIEPGAQALAGLCRRADLLQDRYERDGMIAAASHYDSDFLRAVANHPPVSDAPLSEPLAEVLRVVAEHFARGGPGVEGPRLLADLKDADATILTAIMTGLAAGWTNDEPLAIDEDVLKALEQVIERLAATDRGQLVRLANRWGTSRFSKYAAATVAGLLTQMDDAERPLAERLAAAEQLFAFQPDEDEVVASLLERITPQLEPDLAVGWIEALGRTSSDQLGPSIVGKFAQLTPLTRSAAVALLLKRPAATEALIEALDRGEIQLTELSLDQRQSLARHPSRTIREAARRLLERGGALPNADRQRVLDALHSVTEQTGDPAAGKLVFTKVCAKCHLHGREGNRIGPDLTGMAVHPKHELLIHILDPNRSVESNFRTYTVVTNEGLVLTGMLASESRTALELFNAEGEKKTVLREDIDELLASTLSLMPEGFEKQVSELELRDLLEFLTQRGRFVPVDLSRAATIASDRGMFIDPESDVERLIFEDWSSKEFQGVPFQLIDPRQGRIANVILLNSPNGAVARRMPRSVQVPVGGPAKKIHLLSGVSGWGYPYGQRGDVSLIVRLQYADGETEDHPLQNGIHFADYIRVVDVPESQLAFRLRGQQIRYLAVTPQRAESIDLIEFVKGPDTSAPVVMAVTLETETPSTGP